MVKNSKSFLITGCTRGIGLATAQYLSEEEKKLLSSLPIKRAGLPQEVAFAIGFFWMKEPALLLDKPYL